jgi:signal transduction histidine kinase
VRTLVDMAGGEIVLLTTVSGTSFEITFPLIT